MGAPPTDIGEDRWTLARMRAAETTVGEKWKSQRGRYGVKANVLRAGFAAGYCDTSGNVAAFVKEKGMEQAVEGGSRWLHRREGYEVEVAIRDLPPVVKDADAANWQAAVAYGRLDEEGEDDARLYIRSKTDFLSKFEELPAAPVEAELSAA